MIAGLYLVDTSAWVSIFRRRPAEAVDRRVRALVTANTAASNDLVRMELLVGARDRPEFDRIASSIAGSMWLPITASTWVRATELGYSLRRSGLTFAPPDLLVAACALEHNAVVLHMDSDFDLIAEHSDLQVESYAAAAN